MQSLLLSFWQAVLWLVPFFHSAPAPIATNTIQPALLECHKVSNGMEGFAADKRFIAIHPAVKTGNFNLIGQDIVLNTTDGVAGKAYFVPAKKKSKKWLFVYQEWWGLNEHIKHQADLFHESLSGEVNVLAIDLYDGRVATEPSLASEIMKSTNETRLKVLIAAGQSFAGKKAKIASVGWCFGGSWSLKSALQTGKQNVGCVVYYGMPVNDVAQLKNLNSDVLGIYATEEWISKSVIESFSDNMKAAGKVLNYKIYPGMHGFANPSNPNYDKANADIAYASAVAYLRARLKV